MEELKMLKELLEFTSLRNKSEEEIIEMLQDEKDQTKKSLLRKILWQVEWDQYKKTDFQKNATVLEGQWDTPNQGVLAICPVDPRNHPDELPYGFFFGQNTTQYFFSPSVAIKLRDFLISQELEERLT